jgi:uroporphyrinogen decarboxylase
MLGNQDLTGQDITNLFQRPFMGGLDRHGIIVSGNKSEIESAVIQTIAAAPREFFLGADCTLPGGTDWENIRTAIQCAHQHRLT